MPYKTVITFTVISLAPLTTYASPLTLIIANPGTAIVVQNHASTPSAPIIRYIDFNKMAPNSKLQQLQDELLTFYSNKNEKVEATLIQGAYAINYIQTW